MRNKPHKQMLAEISFLKCLLPSIFNEGIIVSRVCLPAVDNDPHELVVLRDGDLLPGRPPGGPLGSAFSSLPAAVLTGHSGDGVWLHVQHPGELKQQLIKARFLLQ